MLTIKTIKEIDEQLQQENEPAQWMELLAEDPRIGVQKALAKWQRQYNKKALEKEQHYIKKAFDESFAPFDNAYVAGVDEAGRGPLAGPVVTAAVILSTDTSELIGLDDSKAISRIAREQLAIKIRKVAVSYSVHIQSAEKVDELNIYVATRDSMEKAVAGLAVRPDFVIVDAMELTIDSPTESVIKADAKSLAVAAASILAKTVRDDIMDLLHEQYPMYNFVKNAGYGTAEHVAALGEFGPSEHHRRSFEPVKSMIVEKGMKK